VIPIGICSSPILANWYLRDFDKAVKTQVRPAYYGRYVDDILIVVATPDDPSEQGRKDAVAGFMNRVLVHSGVLLELKGDRYEIAQPGGLFLQQGKCILQYFDAKHSIAGLEKFQKKLEENASDFLLLPVDEGDNSLEEVAYELLYEGSANKFRSVKGMAENRYELAKHLARQTILHMLTDDPPDKTISCGLQKFFKGKNAIEFHDLWERVFTFFVVAHDRKAAADFSKQLKAEIKRVRFKDSQIASKLLSDNLRRHLELSEAMSDALGEKSELLGAGEFFRDSNLIRHHFVRLPLLNYTTFAGSLLARSVEQEVAADTNKQKCSPRFVNFDECLLLANSGYVNTGKVLPFQWATEIYETINGHLPEGMEWNREELKAEVSGD
jgi:hypothetical protein